MSHITADDSVLLQLEGGELDDVPMPLRFPRYDDDDGLVGPELVADQVFDVWRSGSSGGGVVGVGSSGAGNLGSGSGSVSRQGSGSGSGVGTSTSMGMQMGMTMGMGMGIPMSMSMPMAGYAAHPTTLDEAASFISAADSTELYTSTHAHSHGHSQAAAPAGTHGSLLASLAGDNHMLNAPYYRTTRSVNENANTTATTPPSSQYPYTNPAAFIADTWPGYALSLTGGGISGAPTMLPPDGVSAIGGGGGTGASAGSVQVEGSPVGKQSTGGGGGGNSSSGGGGDVGVGAVASARVGVTVGVGSVFPSGLETPICSTCGEVFPDAGSLKSHRRKAHPKPKRYACSVKGCPIRFSAKCNLSKHVKAVHHKQRPHVCQSSGCGRAFSERNKLLKHEETVHNGLRPYRCAWVGCAAEFGQKSDRTRHINVVHKGERRYRCAHCKDFGRKSSLAQHLARVHGMRPAAAAALIQQAQQTAASGDAQLVVRAPARGV